MLWVNYQAQVIDFYVAITEFDLWNSYSVRSTGQKKKSHQSPQPKFPGLITAIQPQTFGHVIESYGLMRL